jgi:TolB-like protein/DNA-binding SARP family transcriptional activator
MFRLRVLGGFALEGQAGAPAPPLPQRRAEALLAVLAVCGDLGCTRERLVALLWPESDEAHARHSLRDALRAIRQTVGPRTIPSVGDFLRLDPAVVVSDVASFTQAVRSGRYRDAVSAYAGPLLDGFHVDQAPEFERWLDGERTRLAREYGEALQQLATAAEDAGAWDEAAGWWARAVEHDPHNSHLVLRHMDALAAMGDRANAIRAADAHVRRLREELDLEPDREVLVGIDRIRRGEVPEARPQTAPEPSASVPSVAPTAGTAPNAMLPARGLRRLPLWAPWTAALAAVVLAGVLGIRHWLKPRAIAAGPPRTAIAVLPFQNLTADTAHAYFAGGLHDELLTQLAKVAALTVVGPTSVSGYRQTSKPLRQIGEELGVGSIVEGSVQVAGNRLRVIVQLIEPVSETRLWAEHYDRTLEDAFAVESDIAQRIVGGLGATLTSAEASALAAVPTRNAEAYQFYLQGLDYWRRPGKERANLEIAQQLYERALRLDSTFALAHAALSLVHRDMHSGFYDPSPARAELQRREAEVALRLAPDLPQAHLAMGVVDVGRFDHGRALEELGRTPQGPQRRRGLEMDRIRLPRAGRLGQRAGGVRPCQPARTARCRGDPRSRVYTRVGSALRGGHRRVSTGARAGAGRRAGSSRDRLGLHEMEGRLGHASHRRGQPASGGVARGGSLGTPAPAAARYPLGAPPPHPWPRGCATIRIQSSCDARGVGIPSPRRLGRRPHCP